MKSGLSRDELAQICAILETVPSVDKAVLFGSRAMGLARTNSDVDIMLYGNGLKMSDIMQINSLLEETTLPYQFDLIRHDAKNAALLEHVQQYGKVIFERGEISADKNSWRKGEGEKESRLRQITQTLSSLCKGGGSYGVAASAVEYSPNLPTYLRITDINDDGTLNFEGLKSVDDPNANKYYLSPNDIVFARTGASTGRNYFYDGSDGEFVYAGFLIKFSIDPEKVNPQYVRYYCQSKDYYDWVASFNTGSTRGNINAQTLGNMPIPLLPRLQQDALADTLSTLDAKIANNTKINHHLEQMAQAIFKSWFVDFEPFADAEFVDSELGQIPVGWRIGKVGDAVRLQRGHDLPINTVEDGFYPVIGSKGVIAYHNEYTSTAPVIILGRSGNIGLPRYYNQDCWAHNTAIYSKELYCAPLWVFFMLCQIDYSVFKGGSAVPTLNRNHVESWQIVIPPVDVQNKFHEIIAPFYWQRDSLVEQSARLAALRDTLLPRLMSGELSVVDLSDAK